MMLHCYFAWSKLFVQHTMTFRFRALQDQALNGSICVCDWQMMKDPENNNTPSIMKAMEYEHCSDEYARPSEHTNSKNKGLSLTLVEMMSATDGRPCMPRVATRHCAAYQIRKPGFGRPTALILPLCAC